MARVELATYGLQNRCSAIELHRRKALDSCGKPAPIAAFIEVSYPDLWWHATAPKGKFLPPVFCALKGGAIRIGTGKALLLGINNPLSDQSSLILKV